MAKLKRRKIVVDTNVILFDALAICKFQEADVYIPISVIEEIDRFKRDLGENGRNARHFSRFVDVLREKGSLSGGVQLDNSETVIYVTIDAAQVGLLHEDKVDNRILATALALQKQYPKYPVELITKDINLRIKADVVGVQAKDYEPESVSPDDLYEGYKEIEVTSGQIDQFYHEKRFVVSDTIKVYANEYVIMKNSNVSNHSAVGRFCHKEKAIVPLVLHTEKIWGIHPRNV